MRLSLPLSYALEASAALVAVCGALSCTPQQVVIEKPCPPVEYPVVSAPAATTSPSNATVPRTLDVRLTPTRSDGGTVIAVDVAMRFSVPPVDFGNADPIVLHLDPTRESQMAHVLSSHTKMSVVQVADDMQIMPNTVSP